MSTPTVPVTVTLAAQDGTPYEGVTVRARLSKNEVYEGIVISSQEEAVTDENGVAVLDLFPNAPSPTGLGTQGTTYRFTAAIPGGRALNVNARVPNEACRLENILVGDEVGSLSDAELALLQAQSAVTTAATSASAAAQSAQQTALDRVATGEDRAVVEGIAADYGDISDAVTAATEQVTLATTQAGIATTQAELATTAKTLAEVARDASFATADVGTDLATQRATVADGAQFTVVDAKWATRYRRDTSSTQTVLARFPVHATVRDATPLGARLQWPADTDPPSGYWVEDEGEEWDYICRYISALFDDGTIGTLLDPAIIATLKQDAAGTTNVAAGGDPVQYIGDGSLNGYNATNSDAPSTPSYETDGTLRWVAFGATDYLTLPFGAINNAAPVEIFAALSLSSAGSNPAVVSPISSGVGAYLMFASNTRIPRVAATGGTGGTVAGNATNAATIDRRNLMHFCLDGSNLKLFVNEKEVVSAARTGTIGSPASYRIGYNGVVGIDMKLHGVLAALRTLTAAERALVARYFYKTAGIYRAVAIGDSTVTDYLGTTSLLDLTSTTWQKQNLAVAGHTIANQKTAWQAQDGGKAAKWIVVQVGLNDLLWSEAASVAIARLQDLIDTINADVGSRTKVLVSKMIPCKQRLIDLYGATNGATAYQKWLDMNEAIAGGGATPISGVDGRITAHEPLMNDGSGNLLPAYDTGDGIHPNDDGRAVNAAAWVTAIEALGLTV